MGENGSSEAALLVAADPILSRLVLLLVMDLVVVAAVQKISNFPSYLLSKLKLRGQLPGQPFQHPPFVLKHPVQSVQFFLFCRSTRQTGCHNVIRCELCQGCSSLLFG